MMCSTHASKRLFHVGPHLLLGLYVSQSFKVGALQNFRRRLQTQKVWPAAKVCSSAAFSRLRPHSAWTWRLQQQVSLIITTFNNLIINGFSPVKPSGFVMAWSLDSYKLAKVHWDIIHANALVLFNPQSIYSNSCLTLKRHGNKNSSMLNKTLTASLSCNFFLAHWKVAV